jgi:hypothetical protein
MFQLVVRPQITPADAGKFSGVRIDWAFVRADELLGAFLEVETTLLHSDLAHHAKGSLLW